MRRFVQFLSVVITTCFAVPSASQVAETARSVTLAHAPGKVFFDADPRA